jgi:hypothetical protein
MVANSTRRAGRDAARLAIGSGGKAFGLERWIGSGRIIDRLFFGASQSRVIRIIHHSLRRLDIDLKLKRRSKPKGHG